MILVGTFQFSIFCEHGSATPVPETDTKVAKQMKKYFQKHSLSLTGIDAALPIHAADQTGRY